MSQQPIRFDDGAAYERGMGAWSQLAGHVFLDWLAPAPGLRWVDVGCGNGAFTELLMQRCAPAEAQGIDPSEAQIGFAGTRPGAAGARFRLGDAMVLPFADIELRRSACQWQINIRTHARLHLSSAPAAGRFRLSWGLSAFTECDELLTAESAFGLATTVEYPGHKPSPV